MITIVNYGSGNINAIGNIYTRLNIPFSIAHEPKSLIGAEKIILPGVGAFDETMSVLDKSGFREVLDEEVLGKKTPVIGVCVGMQILGEKSEEGKLSGLGWIKGEVKKFDINKLQLKPKIPHLGWNSVKKSKESPIFSNIDEEQGFYFLHSYYFECADPADIMSQTNYGGEFTSSINHENIFGVQFHPEKSHTNGITLLKNFANLNA